MEFSTAPAPHLPSRSSVSQVMLTVLLALLPAGVVLLWYFGYGVLLQIILAGMTALAAEAGMLALRARPIRATLRDNSALVTAVLLAISLPAYAPWWLAVVGTLFAIVLAKHLYGGLGYNPFNPAMVGYVVLLVSFPKQMTQWAPPSGWGQDNPDLLDAARLILLQQTPLAYDALTQATPLDAIKTGVGMGQTISAILPDRHGWLAWQGWEIISLAYLVGGLWLLRRRVIDWRIPLSLLATLSMLALLGYGYDSQQFASPWFHLGSGAAMLGAFFIATDPVSAATTPRGRLFYGAGVGALIYIIRSFGGYPDGVAFAVLLMNLAAPTIDHYTRPPVFGEHR